jgi:HPt (histidine-containing phosphotransfer) domain-containing protein
MTDPAPSHEGDDTEPILSDLLRDDPSFADIVIDFVDALGDRVHQLESALRAADFETLRGLAHQLKGAGGGYGFPLLTERAAMLETRAGRGSLDECADAIAQLRAIASRIVAHP